MAEFAKYYIDFIWSLLQNIGMFFMTIFSAFHKAFVIDIGSYFTKLGEATVDFDFFGWVTLILVVIINVTLVFFLVYRIFQLIRKYIIFRAKEIEKDELIEEIAKIKEQANQLAYEKNQIFSMKVSGINSTSDIAPAKVEETNVPAIASRFTKLISIDNKYISKPHFVDMTFTDNLDLSGIVDRFVKFSASELKLFYTHNTIRTFFAGMATSKILILEGISGTGKTSLPYAMGKFFKNSANIVSVQPAWRDRADLLGYLNEFTKKFNETDFLANLYEATYRDDLSFVVLDEMNLARIEYYFAEFLSIMEMPDITEWKIDLVPNSSESDPKNIQDGKVTVPQNIWFVGTANQDDSTFTITDKVYDRAISIDLNSRGTYFDAPLTESINCSYDYLEQLYAKALASVKITEATMKNIKTVDEFVTSKLKVTFGNRIMKQIKLFVPVFVACGGDEYDAVDFLLMSKIFRKFKALNLAFLTKEINELITLIDKLFGKGRFVQSTEYLRQILKGI